MSADSRLGAIPQTGGGCRFEVWAPLASRVQIRLTHPEERLVEMAPLPGGYFTAEAEGVHTGARYRYRLHDAQGDAKDRPDPASRFQPEGVHGPSQVVSTAFDWGDRGWCGLPLNRYVLYELHVGTFTPQGTFDAVVDHLDDLKGLGVTAIELMPVAQFPGGRNWGYDGVYPFAVQDTYGGPEGLKRLVNACHGKGLAVALDVVYNHLGPEGNYLRDFGPYFTDVYRTPWGEAVNFDGPHSDAVRRYFMENALQWVREFHVDALRLDAVHAILDFSARPFLEALGRAVHREAEATNRRVLLFAESALNDTRVVRPRELGGFGLDAQWNDDFHHSLHTALTDERSGYYRDFDGIEHLAKAWRDGYVYDGQYSEFRQRSHGNASRNVPARRLVVFSQNHDQVGNRVFGDRLSTLLPLERLKLAAGLVILSPFVPLLFMGEEYGETAPFLYFVSHGEPDLVQSVREGRRREFAAFDWAAEPPDPQDEETFRRSRLNHALRQSGDHRVLFAYYSGLLGLRARSPALANLSRRAATVAWDPDQGLLLVRRRCGEEEAALVYRFGNGTGPLRLKLPDGLWRKGFDSADPRWKGPGSGVPDSFSVRGPVELAAAPDSVVVGFRNPSGASAR